MDDIHGLLRRMESMERVLAAALERIDRLEAELKR